MGKHGTIISCIASLGMFVLGATLGAHRTRRRNRRGRPEDHPTDNRQSPGLTVHTATTGTATSSYLLDQDQASASVSAHHPPHQRKPGPAAGGTTTPPTATTTMMAGAAGAAGGAPSATRGSNIDCPVCLTDMIMPRVTSCGHTICSACLCALGEHERHPCCPVCRRRIRMPLDKVPVNFMAKTFVEERIAQRGSAALQAYRVAEEEARVAAGPLSIIMDDVAANDATSLATRLRPAWIWFKWTVIIVTEFGAFLVSLKEVLEVTPTRNRRYQRIV